MNVTLEISGGFAPTPSLSVPYIVDTDELESVRAGEIETIIRQSHFFELPNRVETAQRGAADYFVYAITIRDGDRVHTVVLTDPISDPQLMRLIDLIKASPRSK
jgi:hypothetical protein